ncbi:serine/threonine-protein kinase PknK [Polyangium aurulentum]|uniref:serine/threonine-protein kinase n=1 Tax=Polyangium aurulentum TaxID=2567896 RepID=UPI0010AE7029|nr:serine/threonine-protein kinase [Polyangium aurulentum]UQA62868.1 protein kinase [Polyangium aurulentum]
MMKPGQRIAARFEIEDVAATGGMSTVYRAKDHETGALVAVKVLGGRSMREMERFSAEAVLLAELRHPGIVRYVSHGATPEGDMYLVMEWLEGEDLAARLVRAGMAVDESVKLARCVAEALAAAHARGIVHRDIKPSNIFLPGGNPAEAKILDFGVARLGYGRTLATRTGMLLGTPGYMAPEQAQGRKDVGASADVFSLGAVLFECLTGNPAFAAEHLMAVLSRILFEEPPRMRELRPEIPIALEQLVASMLAKDPTARPRDGAMVVAALEALEPVAPSSPGSDIVPAVVSRPAITVREQQLLCVVLATNSFTTIVDTEMTGMDATLTPGLLAEAILRRSRPGSRGEEDAGAASGNTTLDDLRGAAASYGGKLERLVDGSLLAVHTGAAAAMDLAARAARTALALRGLLPGVPIAVATGRGLVAERLPVGEAVEAAARTLSGARGADVHGRIVLDEVTAGLLDARFEVREEKGLTVLVTEREREDSLRTLLGKPNPCVGREREIATLIAIFDEAIAEPSARAAFVTGPAGVGKSRLATEVVRRLAAAGHDMEVWVARGDLMAAGSSFGMLAQIIRAAVGIEVGEPLAQQEERLRSRVAACVAPADVERVAVFLGEIMGVRQSAEGSRMLTAARGDAMLMGDQMRRAFEDWLHAECANKPVLLLLEDLHFGDLPTVRFIDAALRHLRDRPLCVLALARPEISRVFPGLWEGRNVQEVRLAELGRRASEQLVKLWLGPTVSREVTARIVERAAGNPFYLEELVRAVAAGRGDKAMPGTVLAMVQARLEELDADLRRIMRAASVFGDVFWPAGIAALIGGEAKASAVREALTELVDREFVVRRSSRRFFDQEDYAFRNALVREAAYATLTDGDRMLAHRLAASWLEASGETEAAVLAQHYERGGEPVRAAGWYARATDTALEGNDFAAVIEHAERAIACGTRGEELGRLRLREAEAHRWRSEFAESEKRGLEAIHILPPGSDPWLFAVGEMATVFGKLGSVERVEILGDALLDVARAQPSPASDGHLTALSRTSTAALLLGKSDLAENLFKELLRLAGDAPGPLGVAWVERAYAFRAPFVGLTGASGRYFARSAEAFAEAGDLRNACLQRANYGAACLEVGDWEGAEQALWPAIADAERMGAKHIVSSAQRDLGYALARKGRLEEARRLEMDAVAEFAAHGDRRLEGVGRDELASILLLMGQPEAAEAEARRAVERLEITPAYLCHGLATLARILLARGNVPEALERARASRALLTEVGALEEGEAHVRLVLALSLAASGQKEEARAVLAEACAEIERKTASIADPDARHTFSVMSEHVETFALAREWGVIGA